MTDILMAPNPVNEPPRPESPKPWYEQAVEMIGSLGKNFESLRACLTVIAVLALVCVLFGRSEFWVFGFATFSMGLLILCGYLNLTKERA
jgi:hypothetical protein